MIVAVTTGLQEAALQNMRDRLTAAFLKFTIATFNRRQRGCTVGC